MSFVFKISLIIKIPREFKYLISFWFNKFSFSIQLLLIIEALRLIELVIDKPFLKNLNTISRIFNLIKICELVECFKLITWNLKETLFSVDFLFGMKYTLEFQSNKHLLLSLNKTFEILNKKFQFLLMLSSSKF
ncbi:hypothetical protein BpHYR1_032141 [Brachionus plicatilis]|uniref:Uncharacterized protein n=1 Tax=Brachionus plicatilis TaxID=10195 RepID=A0A3M7QN39_BRAPC|nr:hypothetical protein BpHYR1_032141 [Brachionus plicatilis]